MDAKRRTTDLNIRKINLRSVSMNDDEKEELEDFISDWHFDKKSHKFAQDIGIYIFQFIEDLCKQGLKDKTVRKHIDNCWAIGMLECGYGYRKKFLPGDVFYSDKADYEYEYGRKFTDSDYALKSYHSTWKKIYLYTKKLELIEDE